MTQHDLLELKYLVSYIGCLQKDTQAIAKELHELNCKLDVYLGLNKGYTIFNKEEIK